jgi:uncharacterized small protein (DUF1192 family)
MIDSNYQLIVLGNANNFHQLVLNTLYKRIEELGLDKGLLNIIESLDFNVKYHSNSPTVVLYYGGYEKKNIEMLKILLEDGTIILPIFNSNNSFTKDIPEILYPINGIKVESDLDIDALVNNILEGFSLLRISRRLFISYKRNESRSAAIQLFERLELAGFDVFLDTHSIKKGDIFQDELWHRLVDTEVVVLLDTADFLSSQWTKEELAKANSMSIGILQLIWPENSLEQAAELSIPMFLHKDDFVNSSFNSKNSLFKDSTIEQIVQNVEGLRARSLAARQDNIITEFLRFSSLSNRIAILQREKFITIVGNKGREIVIIPTIGIPHAFSYNQSEDLIKLIRSHDVEKIWLLYDHINIREKWLKHLTWLDGYLPVNSLKVTEIEEWLKKN